MFISFHFPGISMEGRFFFGWFEIQTMTVLSADSDPIHDRHSWWIPHYNDVIVTAMASQITSLTIVYLIVYSGTDERKNQSSASLAFVRGIHRWLVNSENVSIWWGNRDIGPIGCAVTSHGTTPTIWRLMRIHHRLIRSQRRKSSAHCLHCNLVSRHVWSMGPFSVMIFPSWFKTTLLPCHMQKHCSHGWLKKLNGWEQSDISIEFEMRRKSVSKMGPRALIQYKYDILPI